MKIVLEIAEIIYKQFTYSVKIIFANKFIYFLAAAFAFFLMIVVVSIFDSSDFNEADVFNTLLFPGLLIIFYPSVFGIQNDLDSRMLENLFAIPNYRYKVWLPRIFMIFLIVSFLIFVLASLSSFALIDTDEFFMSFHLMFPILFVGTFSFALSTIVKNGNAAAIIMVIIGLVFWISSGILESSMWNIFLNPFDLPEDMNFTIWTIIVLKNRIFLFSGSIICLLTAMFNLQKREKFF